MTLNNNHLKDNSLALEKISLLEEKLQVARRREKVGEVVIRKQVETRMVQLPIRREKLIVEKVGQNAEKLAEVILTEETLNGFNYDELNNGDSLDLHQSKFISPIAARELLSALAELSTSAKLKVRLEIATDSSEDSDLRLKVKDICERYIAS
ncbi:MAG: DUF2382 domain-containing protein [Cyanobacteria bacterium J06600_6]